MPRGHACRPVLRATSDQDRVRPPTTLAAFSDASGNPDTLRDVQAYTGL
jgi:hypothetical protein